MPGFEFDLVGRVNGEDFRKRVGPGRYVLGRGEDCQIKLTEPSVSRRHAELAIAEDQISIQDLGSFNGTQVNGATIEAATNLSVGDSVSLADVSLRIVAPEAEAASGTMFMDAAEVFSDQGMSWEDISQIRHERTEKHDHLFQVLADAGQLLTIRRAPEELFEPILDLVEAALKPQRTVLLLLEEPGEPPVAKASRLKGPVAEERLVLSKSIVERVLRKRESFVTKDAMDDPRLSDQQSVIMQSIHSAMAAPLFDNEDVIGILYADTGNPLTRYTQDELKAFTLLANVIAVAITHARYHAMEEEKLRLETELDTAREIMDRILPEELPVLEGYELQAHLKTCYEVGGDLYNMIPLDDGRMAILIGDVSGKGLGAALLVSCIMSMMKLLVEDHENLVRLMTRLNRQVYQSTDHVRFATMFVGILDPATGQFDYVNAGHNPPYHVNSAGDLAEIKGTGLPIGMMPDAQYTADKVRLEPGSFVAMYSDGVTEALAPDGQDYGDERLAELLGRQNQATAAAALAAIRDDLEEFVAGAPTTDDVTAVIVRRAP